MATESAMGKRRAAAIARIERYAQRQGAGEFHLPTTTRYGADMLLILQLEALAGYLDSTSETEPEVDSETHPLLSSDVTRAGEGKPARRKKGTS